MAEPNKSDAEVETEGLIAWRYRLDGYSTAEIAELMKLPIRTVQRRISESILAREKPIAEVEKQIELDRMDRMHKHLSAELLAGGEVPKVVHAAVAVSKHRARLLGLDVKRVELTDAPPAEVFDPRLADIVEDFHKSKLAKLLEAERNAEA